MAAAKERERLAALALHPLPWRPPSQEVLLPTAEVEQLFPAEYEEEESEGNLRPLPSDRELALVAFPGGSQEETFPAERRERSKRVRSGGSGGSNAPAPPKAMKHAARPSSALIQREDHDARREVKEERRAAACGSLRPGSGPGPVLRSREVPSREAPRVEVRIQPDSVPSLRAGARLFDSPTMTSPDFAPEVQSPLLLVQMGVNPRGVWMEKFMARTRSEEAKESWKSLLGAYTLPQLEKTYADALLSQECFVANCRSGRLGEGAFLDHRAYVTRFPGIPGKLPSRMPTCGSWPSLPTPFSPPLFRPPWLSPPPKRCQLICP